MGDWDPAQYLRFEAERTRPSKDLAARVELEAPAAIIDIGCGPGNSARVLRERWPRGSILGLDNSPAMIERARRDYPELSWRLGDASVLEERGAYDLVFSNAALQWMPDHESLLPRLFAALRPAGALAAQIPRFSAMPIHRAIERVAASPRWKDRTSGRGGGLVVHEPGFYYDLLCGLAARVDMWQTIYFHVLPSHRALVEFIRSTGMKPYLDSLPNENLKAEFEAEVLGECEKAYSVSADGAVLFPFDRFFFIAYR
jgi:trans-aconitate 2-methyltransferase